MADRTCTVEGCGKPHKGRGFCAPHYEKWKASEGASERPPCSVDGCERPSWTRGFCTTHYTRWKASGNPGKPEIRRHGGSGAKCEFPGCGRKHEAQGLCPGHLFQKRKGKTLVSLEDRQKTTDRDELGRKHCRVCLEWVPTDLFYSNPTPKDKLSNRCIRCARDEKYFRNYGITLDDYENLLTAQNGLCKICGRGEPNGKQLSIDHDHACCSGRHCCGKCIRGLLCSRCNLGMGYFGEDIERMRAAIDYLVSSKS